MTHVDYLVSRPGRPVHLAVFAYIPPAIGGMGRFVPLCGQDRGARWQLTGTWAEKWPRHRRAGMCSRCRWRALNLAIGAYPDVGVPADEPPLFEAVEVAS